MMNQVVTDFLKILRKKYSAAFKGERDYITQLMKRQYILWKNSEKLVKIQLSGESHFILIIETNDSRLSKKSKIYSNFNVRHH
jgi:hypothetical protein